MKMFRKCLEKFGIFSKEFDRVQLNSAKQAIEELKSFPTEKPTKISWLYQPFDDEATSETPIIDSVKKEVLKKFKEVSEEHLEKVCEKLMKKPVANLQEKSEKVLKESSGAKELREQLEFAKELANIVGTNRATKNTIEGTKFDKGKLPYTLLPFKAITEVVKVLEFGKLKYARDNWQKVPNAKERYIDATFRHLIAYHEGEITDPESGLHHLAHATCCLLFVIWFDITGTEDKS